MTWRWMGQVGQFLRSRQRYKFFIRDWARLTDLDICADVLRTMRTGRLVEPLVLDRPQGRRIVVIAPHPDDESIGAGGALLKAAAAGADIRVIYLTTNAPQDITRAEAAAAGAKGRYAIDFLDMPVGGIPVDAWHAAALAERIVGAAPDTLFLPFMMDDHDDHRRASQLLLEASLARTLPDLEVWAYQVYGVVPGNVMIDVTDVAAAKAELIRCWHTQMKRRDWAHYALGMNAFNARFLPGADARYGEAYFVLPLRDYLDLCRRFFAEPQRVYRAAANRV